jgi:hypothetical protein
MKKTFASGTRRLWRQTLRGALSQLPQSLRFAMNRRLVRCDFHPDPRLVLKIAETREELEACFRLLHDAYVSSGFMLPDPSGLRVTIYHALPTTTTLCAKFDGEVVGTVSLIRDGVYGFPMQRVFDLSSVRARHGRIAEVSALAVHPKFRNTGGMILFPLMKFMYGYCTAYCDTRHLVIAVHPTRIEMCESLLFFQRLTENPVSSYDFANGAPAVGAALDLYEAPKLMHINYAGTPTHRNLFRYFLDLKLPNIQLPQRRYHTTNDPVMTADLLDYFFNQRTQIFKQLGKRQQALLYTIYNLPSYRDCLPEITPSEVQRENLRQTHRYSLLCPATFEVSTGGRSETFDLQVIEISPNGFQALSLMPIPLQAWGQVRAQLGPHESSSVTAMPTRQRISGVVISYGFRVEQSDRAWKKFVAAVQAGETDEDLEHASRFLADSPADKR